MQMVLSQLAFVLGTLAVFAVYWRNGIRQGKLSPGPKKLPLIENLLSIPSTLEWETYTKWQLDHTLLCSTNLCFPDVWRANRRLFTKYFNPSNPSINQSHDIIHVKRFLGLLLQKANDFLQHVRTLVGSTTLSMTYGINVQPYNDPYIKIAEDATDAISEVMIAGAFLVDIIPILKYGPEWFPGAKFQRKAAMMRKHVAMVRDFTFSAAEKLMASGEYDPSFITEKLREIEHSNIPDQDTDMLRDVAAVTYMAGADTTASALGTFFLAMVCYPEVQKKAQAEPDKVLNGGLPEHSDITSFPTFRHLLKKSTDGSL